MISFAFNSIAWLIIWIDLPFPIKVAEFILNKPSAIIELTTAQAASAIGVSEPTLIRFCKAVNFDGFQKLPERFKIHTLCGVTKDSIDKILKSNTETKVSLNFEDVLKIKEIDFSCAKFFLS